MIGRISTSTVLFMCQPEAFIHILAVLNGIRFKLTVMINSSFVASPLKRISFLYGNIQNGRLHDAGLKSHCHSRLFYIRALIAKV